MQRANGFLSERSQKLNLADVILVAEFLGVDPKDIILRNAESQQTLNTPQLNISPNHMVPLMSLERNQEGSNVSNQWLVYPYDNNAHKKVMAVAMPDNRMEPEISQNEILFVDTRLFNFSLNQQLILATFEDRYIVGRFKRLEGGNIEISFADDKAKILRFNTETDVVEILGGGGVSISEIGVGN